MKIRLEEKKKSVRREVAGRQMTTWDWVITPANEQRTPLGFAMFPLTEGDAHVIRAEVIPLAHLRERRIWGEGNKGR